MNINYKLTERILISASFDIKKNANIHGIGKKGYEKARFQDEKLSFS